MTAFRRLSVGEYFCLVLAQKNTKNGQKLVFSHKRRKVYFSKPPDFDVRPKMIGRKCFRRTTFFLVLGHLWPKNGKKLVFRLNSECLPEWQFTRGEFFSDFEFMSLAKVAQNQKVKSENKISPPPTGGGAILKKIIFLTF